MRIIGGKHKGRKIRAPKNLPARPTTDITKESLFNALTGILFFDEIEALDLFSGTGNIAYELASRGTPKIIAVDKHPASIRFIRKTASELKMPIQTVLSDVYKFLENPARSPFDFIFADPPYRFEPEKLIQIVDSAIENGYLSPEGILVIEHHKKIRIDRHHAFRKARLYGQSVLSFFEHP